jgi:phage terminase large subunit
MEEEKTIITLDRYTSRWYQIPIRDALINKHYRRIMAVLPRRSGKDLEVFNLCIEECIKKSGFTIFYIFPSKVDAREILWDANTSDGHRVIDYYIPKQLIQSRNEMHMRIRFKNGSVIQLLGSQDTDAVVGKNARGFVFSEFAKQDPRIWHMSQPILRENGGWAIFITTPRGKTHAYELFQIAQYYTDEWFSYLMTIEQTKHISPEEIQQDIDRGIISEDLAKQEYYCSWDQGAEGAYYTRQLDEMHNSERITMVPWQPSYKVHTAWDLGYRDKTCIIYFQVINNMVHVFDYYENNKQPLTHYVNHVLSKEYTYGKHFGPHDIRVHDYTLGQTRWQIAYNMGLTFTAVPEVKVTDGIEVAKTAFVKSFIDRVKCAKLLKALENYRQEWDGRKQCYKGIPLHDWASDACFTGDTKVLTHSGVRRIMDIQDNDLVLTLNGWKPCTKAKLTKKNVQLVEVRFVNGTIVRCTPDHLFLTENGWKSAESLREHTKIQSSLMNLSNISIAKHLIIESVNYLKNKEDVWDITVPNVGHFSLDNGAIVHNSDAWRYLALSLPKCGGNMSPEDTLRLRNEAKLGTKGLTGFFREGNF